MAGPRPVATRVFAAVLTFAALAVSYPAAPRALSSSIVISQVYGGGGNAGAPITHDFIELFNRGNTPVSLGGWSLQYASATGTGNFGANGTQITELPAVVIDPGKYFLVQQAGGTTGVPIAADYTDATPINMSGTAGKVVLASSAVTLGCNGGSTPCSPSALASIVDLVGYGNANFFEGTGAAPTLSNTTSAKRGGAGCTETDQNNADFAAGPPAPRNTLSTINPCGSSPVLTIDNVTITEGDSGSATATFTVTLSSAAPSGVTFDIATQDDSATVGDNDYEPNSLSGQVIPAGQLTSTFAVAVNGDTTVETNETFFVNVTFVAGADLGDGQGVGTITNDDVVPPVFDVVISQVYGGGGNSGATYTNDFIELFNYGTTTVSLAGWSVQYNSATGAGTWQATPLSGSLPPGGYYLVQESAGTGGTIGLPVPDASGTIAMGSNSGKVALRTTTAPLVGACAAGATIVDLVGYGVTTCHEGAAPAGVLSNTTAALRKRGGCIDTNENANDFSAGSPSPRNSATAARSCEFFPAAIHAIQGDGMTTPLLGQDVTTTGIVTGRKTNGFFVQTPDGEVDGDPATSQALFVFTAGAPSVADGDGVAVRGTASEFFSLTQLESTLPGDVVVASSGNALPQPVVLTSGILNAAGHASQLERLEGMRLHADTLVSVAPTNEFGETFTVLGGVSRPMREPGIEISQPVPPDPTTGVPDCCIPRWDENPERLMIYGGGLVSAAHITVTSKVTFSNVTGPLDFTFGAYKLLPETLPVVTGGMTAVPVPAATANEFTVAGFNIENFNNNPTQRRKAALAIRAVLRYPDVIGHIEIASLASLEALATQVNEDAVAAGEPSPGYEARLIPAPVGGTQHLGYLVKTTRVRIDAVTQERAAETYIDPSSGNPATLHDRPPLVLRATVDPTSAAPRPVIVVVNHLRSFIDIELVSGDGVRVRAKRTAQAESLAGLLQELQVGSPSTPVISIGDYNAYQFNDGYTDPIAIIKGDPTEDDQIVVDESADLVDPNFVNLTDELPAGEQYSFIFEGTPQALDHVLVNTVARSFLRRYAVARNNADFPEGPASLAGDVTRPERNSDHDMPVAYFDLTAPAIDGLTVTPDSLGPPNHKMVSVTVGYTATDGSGPVSCSLGVSSSEPIDGPGDGHTSVDWQVIDAHHVQLRAERSGKGSGRIYTITVTCSDATGNTSSRSAPVVVSK